MTMATTRLNDNVSWFGLQRWTEGEWQWFGDLYAEEQEARRVWELSLDTDTLASWRLVRCDPIAMHHNVQAWPGTLP
jgi:hypothetical protein